MQISTNQDEDREISIQLDQEPMESEPSPAIVMIGSPRQQKSSGKKPAAKKREQKASSKLVTDQNKEKATAVSQF